jgi:hypothetical protein
MDIYIPATGVFGSPGSPDSLSAVMFLIKSVKCINATYGGR